MKKPELESVLTSYHKEDMITLLNEYDLFYEVLESSIKNDPISPRSAYILYHMMDPNDNRLQEYINRFITAIEGKTDGQQRDLIRILINMDLNEDQEGKTYDICTKLWTNTFKKPATRYLALKFIEKIVRKYPELIEDFKLLTDQVYLESLSPGVKYSVKKMITNLKY